MKRNTLPLRRIGACPDKLTLVSNTLRGIGIADINSDLRQFLIGIEINQIKRG
jgi:hypothetical protein